MYFNDPSLYREAIYTKMDQELDCDWYFDKQEAQVKGFDTSKFASVTFLPVTNIGPFFWIKGLVGLLRKDYDVYFLLGATRNISLFFMLLFKCTFYKKKRIYLWTHGYYGKEGKLELTLWKRPMFRMADGNFCYGDYACELMKKDGFSDDKLFPIHNSLAYDEQLELRNQLTSSDIYSSHFSNTNPNLLFIGRLLPIKKLDMLVNAVGDLNARGEKYNIVFIGDGSERQMLESLAKKRSIEKNVWFYGACYDERRNAELVFNADLCVAPGNIGLTAMHALMFGCPCMSHDNFAYQMPEFEAIKPGKTGDFFKQGSVESLSESISRWFASHISTRAEVREACYKEIDDNWNPYYQMKIIKDHLK